MDALKSFIDISRTEFDKYADGIDCRSVKAAAELIIDAKKKGGRLHITGIGKPAHIAGYAASLISSTALRHTSFMEQRQCTAPAVSLQRATW